MNQKVNRKRSNTITIRMDDSEKREWLDYCKSMYKSQCGSYADILRHLIESKSTIHIDLTLLRNNTIALNKIGSNLNQIAKHCNEGKDLDTQSYMCFTEVLDTLKMNRDYLKKIWQLLKR